MSTELYIQGYSLAGEDGLESVAVLEIFGIEPQPDGSTFFSLEYDAENSCELSIQESDGKATAITVIRPCGHERFWTAVFNLLRNGPYIAFMPGIPAPFVVNAEVVNHLPEGIVDALGNPKHVSTVSEIMSQILGE